MGLNICGSRFDYPYELTTAASDMQTDALAWVKLLNSFISRSCKRLSSKRLRIVFFFNIASVCGLTRLRH